MEITVPILDKDVVGNLIPQKFPFVMVDSLLSYSEISLIAGLQVSNDNIFTHNGTFTESGLIEHMAQSVALHTGYQFFLRKEDAPTGYIGSIKEIEISKLPQLNEQIQTTVTILHEFAGITLVELESKVNEQTIATGQMKTILAK